jgi:hypothetical protein
MDLVFTATRKGGVLSPRILCRFAKVDVLCPDLPSRSLCGSEGQGGKIFNPWQPMNSFE